MKAEQHLELLGLKATDSVTNFKGVITGISFDLYGCIQAVLQPEVDKDGKVPDGRWFDVTRLNVKSKKPVMTQPNFEKGYVAEGRKGCEVNKPLP